MIFTCPACDHRRELPEKAIGRKFRCPSCQAKIKHQPDGRFEILEGPSEGSPDGGPPPTDSIPLVEPDGMRGKILGHYRLISQIGAGGYSQVYLAEHESLHRRMAVKLLPVSLESTPEQEKRMAREAAALAKVDHRNVVRVYDYGNEQGTPYIAMEYVDGRSLDDAIQASGPLAIDALIKAAGDILAGLEAIHGAEILHRDIKPSNVLIHRDGRAALADFGLARDIPTDSAPPTNLFSGTADYAAPELAVGRPPNVRTDLYAVGATLYKAATGHVPFPGDSTKEKLNKQLYEPLPPPRQSNPEIPAPLENLIVSLLHKEPNQRPSSAREAVKQVDLLSAAREEIQESRASRPIVIKSGGAWPIVITVVLCALVLGAGGLFFVLRARDAREAASAPVIREIPVEAPANPPGTAPFVARPVPSVLHLKQGTYIAGLIEETDTAYRVFMDGRELLVRKLDVLDWYRTSARMAAAPEAALHRARTLYLNAREIPKKSDALSMLVEAQWKFTEARDGFIRTRNCFKGDTDAWLDGRMNACQEGLRLVRDARGVLSGTLPPAVPSLPKPEAAAPAPPEPPANPVSPRPIVPVRRPNPGVPGRRMDPRIAQALAWLARHQDREGSWRVRGHTQNCGLPSACLPQVGISEFDVGVTGLALLSILGSGIGLYDNDNYDGLNLGEAVRRGVAYLVRIQTDDGAICDTGTSKYIYNQATAVHALAEALRSSQAVGDPEPARSDAVFRALGRAVDYLAYAQNPGKGWRYKVRPGDNDSSVTALCVLALEAARRARVKVPSGAFSGGLAWFDEATEPSYGRVGYTHAGTGKVFIPGQNEAYRHHETLAAAAWVCRAALSIRRPNPPLTVTRILTNDRPRPDLKWRDGYYWYYGTRFFKAFGGKDLWLEWQGAVVAALSSWQEPGGQKCSSGSWPPNGRWAPEGGRVYTTAMNLLTLEHAVLSTPFRFVRRAGTIGSPSAEPKYGWTFHLKSGGTIRVIAYERQADGYRLKIRGGTTFIPKGQVDKIERIGE